MTYLQLVVRLASEAGVSGTMASVVGQTGESLRLVNWINSAYESTQNANTTWKFMRHGFTLNTVPGTDEYAYGACTDTDLGSAIVNFGRWATDTFKLYKTSVADETEVDCMDYADWRRIYRIGSQTANRPTNATVLPSDKIGLGAKPDGVYVFSGDYYRSATTLSANGDIPVVPPQYHMVIVWRALMLYAQYEEAGSLYATAEREFTKVNRMLELNQLPSIMMAGPMA